MWNNFVAYLHDGLLTTSHVLLAMARQQPTTMGIAAVVALLILMVAAEIVDGRAIAERVDGAPPVRDL